MLRSGAEDMLPSFKHWWIRWEGIISNRRTVALFILLLLIVAAAVLPIWSFSPPSPPGVTPENFHRLHCWMHRVEVEAILGPGTGHRVYITGGYSESWHGPE